MFVDLEADEVIAMDTEIYGNEPGQGLSELTDRIDFWRDQLDRSQWQMIGFSETGIDRRSEMMDRLLTDAWLRAYPEAQVAIASRRYVQQSIAPGEITPATVIGVLPVDNQLFHIQLTGEELARMIRERNPVMGGLSLDEDELRWPDGRLLDPTSTVDVLIPDVIYYGANYYEVQEIDLDPLDTGINWRQPVRQYIQDLSSSQEKPIEELLAEG
jgi:2',3'-cyclic-nucleotide 2'-phosphodiesterase (5'-nucleotidase family)